MQRAILLLWLTGCQNPLGEVEPPCDPYEVRYPDWDQDGLADTGAVYIGCDPPDDWLVTPPEAP